MWKGFGKNCSTTFNLSESMSAYLPLEEKINTIDTIHHSHVIKVAIGSTNGEVLIWKLKINDPATLSDFETIETRLLIAHDDEITGVNFNETGSKVVSCGLDRFLYVCDVETGTILFKKEHLNSLICMKWSTIDEILYLGDNQGTVHVWNMTDGEKKCSEDVFKGPITSITVMFVNDVRKVVAAGVDYNEFVVKALRAE